MVKLNEKGTQEHKYIWRSEGFLNYLRSFLKHKGHQNLAVHHSLYPPPEKSIWWNQKIIFYTTHSYRILKLTFICQMLQDCRLGSQNGLAPLRGLSQQKDTI